MYMQLEKGEYTYDKPSPFQLNTIYKPNPNIHRAVKAFFKSQ